MTDDPQSQLPGEYDELWSFLDDDGITTPPIPSRKHPEGKVYIIPAPDAETGMRLTALADIARKAQARQRGNTDVKVTENDLARLKLDDTQERDFASQVLSDTYEELVADGVSWPRIQRLTQYAYVFFAMGKDVADKAAREGLFSGGKDVRLPGNRASRRAASRQSK